MYNLDQVADEKDEKAIDPLPVLPPNQKSDLGEGEQKLLMQTVKTSPMVLTPPPIVIFNWGRLGGGRA